MNQTTRTVALSSLLDPAGAGTRIRTDGGSEYPALESGDGSHHPGPPRFVTVGEGLVNPNGHETETRSDLAPWNPDPDGEYEWRVVDAPDRSTATPTGGAVVDFVPDVPGEYTLALDAPDGVHELTVRAFPEEDEADPRPQVELDASVVGDQVTLTATATVAEPGDLARRDLDVEFYVDERARESLPDGAAFSVADVTEPVRVYAVAVGERYSVPDAVDVEPDGDGVSISRPFTPPEWVADSTMYEIFTRRFPDEDDPTFRTIADRIDHVADLGVDVLWMTPFVDTDRGFGTPPDVGGPHGYHTTDYMAVDPDLGTIEDFEALVDACHDHDIRVVFDLVINHTADVHPYFEAATDPDHPDHEEYRDWYRWVDESELEADKYFGWDAIPNLDHGNPEVRAYLLDVVDFWAEKVDGFRCDVAWGVPFSFWTEIYDRVKSADAEFFMLDETLPYDVEMGAGRFDVHHDTVLHETLRDAPDGDAAAILDAVEERARRGTHPDSLWLQYVENHDTDRYLPDHGQGAQLAAGAATFTLPGIPMVYYGQETGMTEYRAPMNWGAFDESFLEFYRNLTDLHADHPALGTGAYLERIEYDADSDRAVAFARHDPETGRRVVVLLAFTDETVSVSVGDYVERTDLLTGEGVDVTAEGDGRVTVDVDSAVVLEADDPASVQADDAASAEAENPVTGGTDAEDPVTGGSDAE